MDFLKKHIFVFLFLSFLVFISYANSLNNGFVSDDVTSIVLNAEMKSMSYIANPASFARRVPYFIIYQIGGINPIGFRLLNIFFHLGSVWLVYALSFFFTKKKNISLIAASLLAVHPVLTESVTWISGGIHSEYTFFLLLSLLLYILSRDVSVIPAKAGIHEQLNRFRVKPGMTNNQPGMTKGYYFYLLSPISYLLSPISYLLSLTVSEKAVVLPLILVAYEVSLGSLRVNWKRLAPFLILVSIAGMILGLNLAGRLGYLQELFDQNRSLRNPLIQIPIVMVTYLRLILFPDVLTFFYSEIRVSFAEYLAYLFFFLLFLIFMAVSWKRNRLVFFWLAYFIITLLPTITPFQISWLIAERYVYAGTVGILFVISYLVTSVSQKKWYGLFVAFVMAAVIMALVIRTYLRNIDWKDASHLWTATVKTAWSSPIARLNLADAYSRRRDYKSAERELKIAIRLNPYYIDAYHALGVLYRITKRDDEALPMLQKAVELNPNLWQGHRNIGLIYMEKKEYQKGLKHIKKGLSINPSSERMKRDLEVILREIRGR